MPYQIQKRNISTLKVDVAINTTDSDLSLRLFPGAGRELNELCRYLSPLPPGGMELTPSFGLSARDILHFSVPARIDDAGELRSYYERLLSEAARNGGRSVAIPLFPRQNQTRISPQGVYAVALGAIRDFLKNSDRFIYLVVDNDKQIPIDEILESEVKAFIRSRFEGFQHGRYEYGHVAAMFGESEDDLDDGLGLDAGDFGIQSYSLGKAYHTNRRPEQNTEPADSSDICDSMIRYSIPLYALDLGADDDDQAEDGSANSREDAASISEKIVSEPADIPCLPSEKRRESAVPHRPRLPIFRKSMSRKDEFYRDLDPETDFIPEESFAEAVLRIIDAKGMSDPQCYSQANLSRAVFNKLKQSALNPAAPSYQPSKATALALAIGLQLTKEEADTLLKKAGFAFSNSSRSDLIVEYFLINGEYDIFELNEVLFRFGQQPLGSF